MGRPNVLVDRLGNYTYKIYGVSSPSVRVRGWEAVSEVAPKKELDPGEDRKKRTIVADYTRTVTLCTVHEQAGNAYNS